MVIELVRGTIEPFLYWQSLILTVLVVGRQLLVLLENRALVASEQALRSAAATLAAAHDRAGINAATVAAVGDLAGPAARPEVRLVLDEGTGAVVAATSSRALGAPVDLARLAERLDGGRSVHFDDHEVLAQAGLNPAEPVLAVGLDADRVAGALLVDGGRSGNALLPQSLETLAAQLSLACARVGLAEDLHRRASEARFRSLVTNASDVILVVDAELRIVYAAPSLTRVFGYAPETVEGGRLDGLLHPDDAVRTAAWCADVGRTATTATTLTEWRVRHSGGGWRDVEATAGNLLDDPNVAGIVVTMRDVTERKALERALAHQALHDSVTALANRVLFSDRLAHALARSALTGRGLAVLTVDVDDFRSVNDAFGHSAGDELLGAVADRLRACIGAADTAARLGGDEFAILVEDVPGGGEEARAAVTALAERCLAALAEPFTLGGRETGMTVGIGIAAVDPDQPAVADADDLLRRADVAMYAAKGAGKGRIQWFSPSLHADVLGRLHRRADLERAITEGELVLHYQPIVDLATARMVAVEALVRWDHPDRGLVPPLDFIPLAEETGLIIPLGRWVIETACAQAGRWQAAGGPHLNVGINLSVRQFADPGLVADVTAAVAASGCDPSAIVLEITESVLAAEPDTVAARLAELKQLGLKLSVDDFGTGYSSLGYLRQFPIDGLKIDKSFVDRIGEEGTVEDEALVRTILTLADSLHMAVVAEGIEQAGQWHALRALGCRNGQGFYFARPVPPDELEALRALDRLPAGEPRLVRR
jgi:diguanylate cyclase (GGDEF)-like protein/PAS domain S-box-containing protein